MKKVLTLMVAVASLTLSASSLDDFADLNGSLNIAGGTAHIKCEKQAIKNIMKKYPNISITIAGGGSGIGIKQVSSGIIDLANSGRQPTEVEIEKGDLKLFRFAIDGIGIIVNPQNPISNLTTQQLQKIFSGEIKNYKHFSANSALINLYTRDQSSATRKVFWKKALEKSDIAKTARVVSSNSAMKTVIKNDRNAIGIISLGLVDKNVKLISVNGVHPTLENVKNGSYNVSRGLFLLSSGEPKPLAKAFIKYMRSKEGSKIVSKNGFLATDE